MNLLRGSAQYYSQYDPIMNFIRIFCVLQIYVSTSGVSLLSCTHLLVKRKNYYQNIEAFTFDCCNVQLVNANFVKCKNRLNFYASIRSNRFDRFSATNFSQLLILDVMI